MTITNDQLTDVYVNFMKKANARDVRYLHTPENMTALVNMIEKTYAGADAETLALDVNTWIIAWQEMSSAGLLKEPQTAAEIEAAKKAAEEARIRRLEAQDRAEGLNSRPSDRDAAAAREAAIDEHNNAAEGVKFAGARPLFKICDANKALLNEAIKAEGLEFTADNLVAIFDSNKYHNRFELNQIGPASEPDAKVAAQELAALLAGMTVLGSGPTEKKLLRNWLRKTPTLLVAKIRKLNSDQALKMDRILERPDPETE